MAPICGGGPTYPKRGVFPKNFSQGGILRNTSAIKRIDIFYVHNWKFTQYLKFKRNCLTRFKTTLEPPNTKHTKLNISSASLPIL